MKANGVDLVVGAPAYRVSQSSLQSFVTSWKAQASDLRVVLALDSLEDITSLEGLAQQTDLLLYAPQRQGLGTARRKILAAGLALRAPWILAVDSDGQYRPEDVWRTVKGVLEGSDDLPDAAIPQRSRVHLPLGEGGDVDRYVGEKFENFCVARAAGQPDLADRDFQPGCLLLSASTAAWALQTVHSAGFNWDMEFCLHVLTSGRRVVFPPVQACLQTGSNFTRGDSASNLRGLAELLGAGTLRNFFTDFQAATDFAPARLASYGAFLDEVLHSGVLGP